MFLPRIYLPRMFLQKCFTGIQKMFKFTILTKLNANIEY